jgi:predicted unusual protein kinase regulating ubiquinone biosynthesis (AarF/ABC1/UbiB family)
MTERSWAPVSIEMPTPGVVLRGKRFARTVGLLARHLVPAGVNVALQRQPKGVAISRGARAACEELGATYVKFAQLVASAPAVVGPEVADEFRGTLDRGPSVSYQDVKRIFREQTGKTVAEAFATFERRPFAAASMAVVHRATLHDGRTVAVKVLRPRLAHVVAADLGLMVPFFRMLARLGNEPAFQLVSYLSGLQEQIGEELDLRNEARSMGHFRLLFERFGLDLLVVPQVHEELSGTEVLTMEYLDGVPIDALAMVAELGLEPKSLIRELLRAWVLTAVHTGTFHADIHAGNLLAMPDGRLGMLDWGIVAQLDAETQLLMQKLVEASLGDDEAWHAITATLIKVQGTTLREGLGLNDEEIHRVVRAMMEPILTRPLQEVSMSSIFAGPDEVYRMAGREIPPRRSPFERLKKLRTTARAHRIAFEDGYHETSFQRSNFLSSKQLIYLERYGRMYVPEHAILGDKEFLETVVAGMKAEREAALADAS